MQQNVSHKAAVSLSERYRDITTIAQAFTLDEPALAKTQGNVRDSIIMHLSALARFLNLRNSLTDEHIEFIADRILKDEYYRWLKPADLKLFFDRIKMGKYGDFYGNLNSMSFFQALDRYMIERNQEIERVRVQEQKQHASDIKQAVTLSYMVGKDGRITFNEAKIKELERKQAKREAIEAETRRKQEVARNFFND